MSQELFLLLVTAGTLGFVHTLAGPDHYLPFIVISKAKKWSPGKTAWITFLCGLGHVCSSILIGTVGIAFGIAILKVTAFESIRDNVAGWMLFGFGLAYFVYGLQKSWKRRPHVHEHLHDDGEIHKHTHTHEEEHAHVHIRPGEEASITPWILFSIFVFGPCKILIPLLMYPAAEASVHATILVALVFSLATVGTMMTIVMLGTYGFRSVHLPLLERNVEAVAGFSIMLCGAAIQFLGL